MDKLKLPNVTLVCIDCKNYGDAITAIKKSQYQVEFGATKFLTDIKAYNPKFPFEIVKIDTISTKEEYSKFVIKELYKYVDTDYALIIQHDGYVLDANAWSDEFFEHDYIGAAWLENEGPNVGNGGFSLRSKRLQNILATDDFIMPLHPEDNCIAKIYRPYLEENYGIMFAPTELADKFSFELREPIQPTFGFHGNFHKPYTPTIVIKRSAALGDCVAIEPVLEYYHKKGYKVAIDMPLELAMVYAQHHYPVFHISQLDNRVPTTVIDLDGSYEANPKQLHLKSYYEAAGIFDGEVKNPKLNFVIGEHNRIFKRYIVLHIDDRDQPYRNVYGVNWREVVQYLNKKGYTVIQVGLSKHEPVEGAIEMKTIANNFLMYVVAGASYFIGVDSGPASIAVATGVPSVIFFGSVDPSHIHPDLSNICVIQKEKSCDTPKCWSDVVGGTTGKGCVVDAKKPPCTQYNMDDVMYSIDKFIS